MGLNMLRGGGSGGKIYYILYLGIRSKVFLLNGVWIWSTLIPKFEFKSFQNFAHTPKHS